VEKPVHYPGGFMGIFDQKDSRPGYRVQPGATNGPYSWGNGPQPKKKGCCRWAEAGKAITRLEFKLAARFIRIDIKHRMGVL
jgi:hypothetical protein